MDRCADCLRGLAGCVPNFAVCIDCLYRGGFCVTADDGGNVVVKCFEHAGLRLFFDLFGGDCDHAPSLKSLSPI